MYEGRFPEVERQFAECQSSSEVGRLYRRLVKLMDLGEIACNDGALAEYQEKANERFQAETVDTRSAEERRAERVLQIVDSDGKRRARR